MPPNWHTVLFSILAAAIAAVIWLIRLEAKVNYLDKMVEAHLANSQRVEDKIQQHFERIEQKLDKLTHRCAAFHADWQQHPNNGERVRGGGQ